MKNEIEKLKELGADVQEVKGGLKLIGDWEDRFNEFNHLFTEITGVLDTSYSVQHPNFLKNLTSLGELDTNYSVQDPDFLKNLNSLGGLNTYNSVQHSDFLKNLTSLGGLDTANTIQKPGFLKNLTRLGWLDTSYSVQHPNFLKNLTSLGELDTSDVIQHLDFLKDVRRTFDLPYLYKDSILSFVHSTKVIDGITIHKTNRIGFSETEYVAIKGDLSAHADSLKLALVDLRFKESDRDTSWLEDKSLDSILSFEDSIIAYRCITGACSGGVNHFLKSIKEKEEYRIGEIIDLTKGEYGNETFSKFFNKNK